MEHEYKDVRLTGTNNKITVTVEMPWDSTSHEWMDAFKTIVIGMGFLPEAFDDAVLEYMEKNELLKE